VVDNLSQRSSWNFSLSIGVGDVGLCRKTPNGYPIIDPDFRLFLIAGILILITPHLLSFIMAVYPTAGSTE
jgi:hypothetical protein